MAEDRNDSREITWRTLFPWTELFRGFSLALDPNKIFLAAIGIFATWIVWAILAAGFTIGYDQNPPDFKQLCNNKNANKPEEQKAVWPDFARDRRQWNLMHRATGVGSAGIGRLYALEDLDLTFNDYTYLTAKHEEYLKAKKDEKSGEKTIAEQFIYVIETLPADVKLDESKDVLLASAKAKLGKEKPHSELNTLPWSENRGPNPFLLATGQMGRPWEAGHFWDWFLREQLPVVIEPVRKLVLPLVFFFSPDATGRSGLYFFLVFASTVAIWSLVGGAITRIAAVQIARGEKIDFMEAVQFTLKRWSSYLMAPVYPLAFIILLLVVAIIFGVFHLIPVFGDIVISGLLWPIPIILGLVMALALIGLVVGWPLMAPTISTEGTDSWEALSRSFSYVFTKPFHYLWYVVVAISYGAVLIFFIGFVGSFAVYLSKWAVSQTPGMTFFGRDPVFLFVYAPKSFGWQELLLKDKLVDGDPLVVDGQIQQTAYDRYLGPLDKSQDALRWWNKFGASMVAFWLCIVFLLMLGFGYSLFWSLTTIIYFLLRRNVDAAEMDEVYLEEDEHDLTYSGPLTPPAPPPAKSDQPPLTMVDSPTLRAPSGTAPPPGPPTPAGQPSAASSPDTPAQTEPVKPATTDGSPPPS
jgi:hypothetical protein